MLWDFLLYLPRDKVQKMICMIEDNQLIKYIYIIFAIFIWPKYDRSSQVENKQWESYQGIRPWLTENPVILGLKAVPIENHFENYVCLS